MDARLRATTARACRRPSGAKVPVTRRHRQDGLVSRRRSRSPIGVTEQASCMDRSTSTMIGTETISRVIGQDVYDESGEKIGSAAEVYLDDETGQPEWVTVRTGLFGTKESFVPIRNADLTNDGVRVPVSKTQVKDAPKIDTDGHLSPQEEQELYRYYGMGTGTTDTGMTTGMAGTGRTDTDLNQHGTVGHDTSG